MKTQSKIKSRITVMTWWNILTSTYKTLLCRENSDILGFGRKWKTLTGREIEMLYEQETDPEINVVLFESNKNKGTQRSPFGIGS